MLRKEDWERIGRLKTEERVNLAVGMSDVCVRVCVDVEAVKKQAKRDNTLSVCETELG